MGSRNAHKDALTGLSWAGAEMKYHIHYVISVDTSLSPCATPLSLDNLLSVETIPKLIRIAFSWQIDCGSPRLEIAAIELGQIETKC